MILGLLGIVALVFLIILLKRTASLIYKINKFWDSNSKNISSTVEEMPKVLKNVGDITENVNLVSEVATEMTASIVDKTDRMLDGLNIFKEIINVLKKILKNRFKKIRLFDLIILSFLYSIINWLCLSKEKIRLSLKKEE
ncbi:hypothetical protein [Clostridium acetobutylicum]|uniref:hypothetical protein n=1 Tax=Clostridium acetobutylicum TaxID=1488 RepID=UPI001F4BCEC2|nr:hypothetical protein [Clostridium acetobutylicum]NRY56710.1 uncharacterized protein YoxC [Clostridium acetobutylicum]